MNFLSTFIQVLIVVALAVPGFVLRKAKLLPENTAGIFAALLLYVAQPFLMMSSILGKEFRKEMLADFGWVALFAIVTQLAVYFAAKLIFCKTKEEAYLGNVGFMGIPVMEMLFPGNGDLVLYTVVYNIVFNAMCWTLGVYAITGERKSVRPIKILLNPPTIAVIVALPFFFCNVAIPEQVMTPIGYLGDMTLPLSMIILGIRLADMAPKKLVDPKIYLVAFVKLVVAPLLSLGIVMLVALAADIDRYVIIALFIIAAMPSASSTLTFAELYGGDRETAAAATLMNTLLCVISIPVLMMLCEVI